MKQFVTYHLLINLFLIAAIVLSIAGCQTVDYKEFQALTDSISEKWVPDQREGIWSVTVSPGKNGSVILLGETTSQQAKLELVEVLSTRSVKIIDSISILPDTIKNDHFWGVVALSVINLRREPAHSSELVSQAVMGTPVQILKNDNSWILVQTHDKYIAWTERSSVKSMTSPEFKTWRESEKVIYTENYGSVYTSPDEADIASDLVAGCILRKTGELNDFVKVELANGDQGFVRKIKTKDFNSWRSERLTDVVDIINISLKYKGIPYLWGGTSSKAVDCSGFVQSVFFMNGVILPRDASLQGRHGTLVDIENGLSELERGDLLFFGSGKITHVGIYKGDTEFIHASSYVMVNSLDSLRSNYSSFRRRTLISAKRIIGTEKDNGIVPVSEHVWY